MTSPAHRGDEPNDRETLTGQWHIGRFFVGMFPSHELSCPCPKARCGLAAPTHDVPCEEHLGNQTIRQMHSHDDCEDYMRKLRRRKGNRWNRN